jgi:hypothetical protein
MSTLAVANVSSGLSTLDFDPLVVNLVVLGEHPVNSRITIESDETEPAWATGVLVHHEGSIKHSTELLEELLEFGIGALLANTADEDLRRAFLFLAGNGSLRVDLISC